MRLLDIQRFHLLSVTSIALLCPLIVRTAFQMSVPAVTGDEEGDDFRIPVRVALFVLFSKPKYFCVQLESASPVAGLCTKRRPSTSTAMSRF